MIKKLRIKNFQKHKSIDIEFDDHITSIVGPSDSGKSALIRALKWVITNKPNGMEFIREGSKKCSVRIETDNHKITRSRGTENTYHLDKEVFHAFGNNVPKEIIDSLRMDEINFQGQHDSPFWLNESAGQVSRNLNQIVNLGIIDSTLSSINKTLKKAKLKAEWTKERFKEAKDTKKALSWALSASDDLGVIETKQSALESSVAAQNRLVDLVDRLKDQKEIDGLLSRQNQTKSILELIETRMDHEHKQNQLTMLINQIKEQKAKITSHEKDQQQTLDELGEFKKCPLCLQNLKK